MLLLVLDYFFFIAAAAEEFFIRVRAATGSRRLRVREAIESTLSGLFFLNLSIAVAAVFCKNSFGESFFLVFAAFPPSFAFSVLFFSRGASANSMSGTFLLAAAPSFSLPFSSFLTKALPFFSGNPTMPSWVA